MTQTQKSEYPRRMRHYFKLVPNGTDEIECFMDVYIHDSKALIRPIDITDFGCVIDRKHMKPMWLTNEILENEKLNIQTK